jgi:hypothetical protein
LPTSTDPESRGGIRTGPSGQGTVIYDDGIPIPLILMEENETSRPVTAKDGWDDAETSAGAKPRGNVSCGAS